jgi:hypothetical protein
MLVPHLRIPPREAGISGFEGHGVGVASGRLEIVSQGGRGDVESIPTREEGHCDEKGMGM